MTAGSIIGAQWTNNSRNWNGKAGWDIELVYATNPSSGFDLNTVAGRVQSAHQSGRNVLVRVDYTPGQSIPPTNNDAARTTYVEFLQTMCQTAAYNQNVWGYIVGNEPNLASENTIGPAVTPTWYARVFNGYNAPVGDTGNAYQFIKTYQPGAHVLVGPVGPWYPYTGSDDGSSYTINTPWLNYFNELCRNVYSGAAAKGLAIDSFSIHAYGRPNAPNGMNYGANEPHTDIQTPNEPSGAWFGFTVYKNWRDIINQHDSGVPVFLTETNTDTGSGSASTYPSGWYEAALAEITSAGPRFWSVCWFVDENYGGGWTDDSLQDRSQNCAQADDDFNYALTNTSY